MTETTRLCRPFDRIAEQEGAPISCRQVGYTPRIFERTLSALFGTVETPDGHKFAQEWSPDGHARNTGHRGQSQRDLVMVPLDWVQGQPVYHGDVVFKGRRKVAVNAGQSQAVTGNAPPWAGATMEPREPEAATLAAGGNGGYRPRIGDVVPGCVTRDDQHVQPSSAAWLAKLTAEPGAPRLTIANFIDTDVESTADKLIAQKHAAARARKRIEEIVAAINAVAEHAPRIQLEQAAAAMQQAAVREILAKGPELGWVGHERAAAVVRSLSVDEVVNKMLGVQS